MPLEDVALWQLGFDRSPEDRYYIDIPNDTTQLEEKNAEPDLKMSPKSQLPEPDNKKMGRLNLQSGY